MRSERIGLRLYAIALEPICSASNGSDSSREPREQAHVVREARRADRDAAEHRQRLPVGAARVRLPRDRHGRREARALARPSRSSASTFSASPSKSARNDACVPVVPLLPRNGTSRAARSTSVEVVDEVGEPQARALADRRRLRRLEVRVGEARGVAVLRRANARERGDRLREPGRDEPERLAHEQRVGVVGHVAATSRRGG